MQGSGPAEVRRRAGTAVGPQASSLRRGLCGARAALQASPRPLTLAAPCPFPSSSPSSLCSPESAEGPPAGAGRRLGARRREPGRAGWGRDRERPGSTPLQPPAPPGWPRLLGFPCRDGTAGSARKKLTGWTAFCGLPSPPVPGPPSEGAAGHRARRGDPGGTEAWRPGSGDQDPCRDPDAAGLPRRRALARGDWRSAEGRGPGDAIARARPSGRQDPAGRGFRSGRGLGRRPRSPRLRAGSGWCPLCFRRPRT